MIVDILFLATAIIAGISGAGLFLKKEPRLLFILLLCGSSLFAGGVIAIKAFLRMNRLG